MTSAFHIKIGETIRPTPKSPHKVNIIVLAQPGIELVCYDLINCIFTDSSIFVLPFMGGNRKLCMWDTQFINAFMGTPEDDCIALLYRFSGDTFFTRLNLLCARSEISSSC